MGILLTAGSIHENSGDEMRRAQTLASAQEDGSSGVRGRKGVEVPLEGPGPLSGCGQCPLASIVCESPPTCRPGSGLSAALSWGRRLRRGGGQGRGLGRRQGPLPPCLHPGDVRVVGELESLVSRRSDFALCFPDGKPGEGESLCEGSWGGSQTERVP